jgi:hypothetical protein
VYFKSPSKFIKPDFGLSRHESLRDCSELTLRHILVNVYVHSRSDQSKVQIHQNLDLVTSVGEDS